MSTSVATRVEPTRHLYAGHVYTPAAKTDLRTKWAAWFAAQAEPETAESYAQGEMESAKSYDFDAAPNVDAAGTYKG